MKTSKKNFKKKIDKITLEEFLTFLLLESHISVLYNQELIDKWNNPEDIMVRAAVLIRDTHKMYGRMLLFLYKRCKDKGFVIKRD